MFSSKTKTHGAIVKCPKDIMDAHSPTTKRRKRKRKDPTIVIKTL
jgi:hypothetical protein